jgi:hypothetical protein
MTNQEAKFTLSAYRPGGSDAGDPMFGDALTQAQRDPVLGAWFATEQRHGSGVSARLREIAPPPGLREAILAGARASGGMPVRSWWTRPGWMALAASVAVMIGVTATALWRHSGPAQMDRLEAFAVDDTLHGRHGSHGDAANALNVLLSQPTTHLGGQLPVDFATLRATGCRTLSFAGHDVIEICFTRGGAEFHLYALQSADFPGLPASAGTESGTREGMGFASWVDAAHRYVLVSAAGMEAIRHLL